MSHGARSTFNLSAHRRFNTSSATSSSPLMSPSPRGPLSLLLVRQTRDSLERLSATLESQEDERSSCPAPFSSGSGSGESPTLSPPAQSPPAPPVDEWMEVLNDLAECSALQKRAKSAVTRLLFSLGRDIVVVPSSCASFSGVCSTAQQKMLRRLESSPVLSSSGRAGAAAASSAQRRARTQVIKRAGFAFEDAEEAAASRIQRAWRGHRCRVTLQRMKTQGVRRARIVKELVETERSYAKSLHTTVTRYLGPLLKHIASETAPLVSPTDVDTLFSSIKAIERFHSALLARMEARMSNWGAQQTFADLFLDDSMAKLDQVYSPYVRNYAQGSELLLRKKREVPQFLQLLKSLEADKTPDLEDLLVAPIQRIPRYKLLLTDLLNNTWDGHLDKNNIQEALALISQIGREINERQREEETSAATIAAVLKGKPAPAPGQPSLVAAATVLPWLPEEEVDRLVVGLVESMLSVDKRSRWRLSTTDVTGAAICEWLIKRMKVASVDIAIQLGQQLMERGAIVKIPDHRKSPDSPSAKRFENNKILYHLRVAKIAQNGTLNKAKIWKRVAGTPGAGAARDPVLLSQHLLDSLLQVMSQCVSESDRVVDLSRLTCNSAFFGFTLNTAELQAVNLKQLGRTELRVFLINLYNALLIHAIINRGSPQEWSEWETFCDTSRYLVGGHLYNLSSLLKMIAGFPGMPSAEPRLLMALCTGTVSGPPLHVFRVETFEEDLAKAAAEFLDDNIQLLQRQNAVMLPALAHVYREWFGPSDDDVLQALTPLMSHGRQEQISKLSKKTSSCANMLAVPSPPAPPAAPSLAVTFSDWSWSPMCFSL